MNHVTYVPSLSFESRCVSDLHLKHLPNEWHQDGLGRNVWLALGTSEVSHWLLIPFSNCSYTVADISDHSIYSPILQWLPRDQSGWAQVFVPEQKKGLGLHHTWHK